VIGLLLRLYPAAWRRRFGDEFAALLEERPIGPFDVADVLLGAVDAHLNLRGRWAGAGHRRGFAMTLRIGGLAAIAGSILFATGMVWTNSNPEGELFPPAYLVVIGNVILIVALMGLSAFQARHRRGLVWAAFAIPAVGNALSVIGIAGMTFTDAPFIGGESGWAIWGIGLLTMLLGSILFAVATLATEALSRRAAIALLTGCAVTVLGAGGFVPFIALGLTLFVAGWIWLGIDAIRRDRPAIAPAI
jgi:hypothetical protein